MEKKNDVRLNLFCLLYFKYICLIIIYKNKIISNIKVELTLLILCYSPFSIFCQLSLCTPSFKTSLNCKDWKLSIWNSWKMHFARTRRSDICLQTGLSPPVTLCYWSFQVDTSVVVLSVLCLGV